MLIRVLLVIPSSPLRRRLKRILAPHEDVSVSSVRNKSELRVGLDHYDCDVIVLASSFSAKEVAWVGEMHKRPEQPEVIILTDREDAEKRARWLASGCMAVLSSGLSDESLNETLAALLERRREVVLERLKSRHAPQPSRLNDFVSGSPVMQAFLKVVRRVLAADTPLLICGETGVGKERLASAIHFEGPRAAGPFIALNCGALPEGLLESELFGHEEGAFTGASRAHRGHFELAHQGTLFLDEIGEMPIHLQVKLLRALQEKSIRRVGGEKPIHLNVRVIAATNRDLLAEIEARRFRQDLYYRLAVITLTVPPLRERSEDIPALVESYVEHFRSRLNVQVYGVAEEALQSLLRYPWPGNVRELINVLERAILLCEGTEITLQDLPLGVASAARTNGVCFEDAPRLDSDHPMSVLPKGWLEQPWKEVRQSVLGSAERAYFVGLLRATQGRIGETARRAGMDPRSLYEKMRAHGLKKEDFTTGLPLTPDE